MLQNDVDQDRVVECSLPASDVGLRIRVLEYQVPGLQPNFLNSSVFDMEGYLCRFCVFPGIPYSPQVLWRAAQNNDERLLTWRIAKDDLDLYFINFMFA